jgi:hypothetical protein
MIKFAQLSDLRDAVIRATSVTLAALLLASCGRGEAGGEDSASPRMFPRLIGPDPAVACFKLAASPIEARVGERGGPGVSIDAVAGAAAVQACQAATNKYPNSGADWRRLGRAYYVVGDADRDAALRRLVEVYSRAAALGDVPTLVDFTIFNFTTTRTKTQILGDARRLESQLYRADLREARDLFAFARLQAAILELEANAVGRAQGGLARHNYIIENRAQAEASLQRAMHLVGASTFFRQAHEMKYMSDCQNYPLTCELMIRAIEAQKDPDVFMQMAVGSISDGYHQTDLAYRKNGGRADERERVLWAAGSLADQAAHYAELSRLHGDASHAEAAAKLKAAILDLRRFGDERFELAEQEAHQREAQALALIGGLIVMGLANPSQPQAASGAEQPWFDAKQARCDYANTALAFSSGMSGEQRAFYRSESAWTC